MCRWGLAVGTERRRDLAILTDSWVTRSVSAIASGKEEGIVSVAEKAAICFVKASHILTFPRGTMRGRKGGRGVDVSVG